MEGPRERKINDIVSAVQRAYGQTKTTYIRQVLKQKYVQGDNKVGVGHLPYNG